MEKKREKALAKKATGGKKKKDDSAPVTKARIKMKDSELYEKADPILFATQNYDSFELSSLTENKNGNSHNSQFSSVYL
jgi:hypothetical protein